MTNTSLSRPTVQAGIATVLDFLELVALIERSGRARIDTLMRDRELQADEAVDDFGDADAAIDGLIHAIENELESRSEKLGAAYPFLMSDDGEEILREMPDNDPLCGSYLACLIASQIGDRSDLKLVIPDPSGLGAEIVTRMRRRIFQMIGTIALAGIARGPSASVGWPREKKETIIETMTRAFSRGFPIPIRTEPNYTALKEVKDGGVDVVAWEHTDDPPSPSVWFGQIASGQNWRGKPVIEDAKNFSENFLEAMPRNANHATIIPFQLDDEAPDTRALHHKHGHILDRLRLIVRFREGLGLIASGLAMDESQNTLIAMNWVDEFVERLRHIANAA